MLHFLFFFVIVTGPFINPLFRPTEVLGLKVYIIAIVVSSVGGSYFLAFFAVKRYLIKQHFLMFGLMFLMCFGLMVVLHLWLAPEAPKDLFVPNPGRGSGFQRRPALPLQILLVIYTFPSMVVFFKKLMDSEVEKRSIEQEQLKTELNFLKNQISPHFLFNSLNAIYALTTTDNKQAGQVTLQLSRLLRYLVYETEKQKQVALKTELDFLQNFIELSKMRLQGNMKVKFEVDIDDPAFNIPPLILLIFVENSFKHGVTTLEVSEMTFKLKQLKNELWFETSNRKVIKNGGKEKAGGVGIQNAKRRLELIYGEDNFNLTFGDDGDRYHVKLWIKNYEN